MAERITDRGDSEVPDFDTLRIRVESEGDMHDRIEKRLQTAETDDAEVEPTEASTLSLPSVTQLAKLLTASNLRLLEAIATENPESMNETARLVDRDYKEVHRNLTDLEAHGLIEFVEEGRSKRPVVAYDTLTVELDLGAGVIDVTPAAESG